MSARSRNGNLVGIRQIDPPAEPNSEVSLHPLRMIVERPLVGIIGTSSVHLVERGSELMLIGFPDKSQERLMVYRLADLISGRNAPVTNIGDDALFLGHEASCVFRRTLEMPPQLKLLNSRSWFLVCVRLESPALKAQPRLHKARMPAMWSPRRSERLAKKSKSHAANPMVQA